MHFLQQGSIDFFVEQDDCDKSGNKKQPQLNLADNMDFVKAQMAFPCFKDCFNFPAKAVQFNKIINGDFTAGEACDENCPSHQE
jgi:hypothetical protein